MGQDHPDLSYGFPAARTSPTPTSIWPTWPPRSAMRCSKTGIDGFMIDWLWQPERKSTGGKWLECEKQLYAQLTGAGVSRAKTS